MVTSSHPRTVVTKRVERHESPALQRIRAGVVMGLVVLCLMAGSAVAAVVPPGEQRTELTADALLNGTNLPDQMIHNDWFMPVGEAGPALHTFSGTLVIPETEMLWFDGEFLEADWYPEGTHGDVFPAVDVGFISHGDYLVPVDAGIIKGTDEASAWDLIVSPGRVWSEPSDDGFSRGSFPFVLAYRSWGEAHNGLATFVFDGETISGVQFQIVQETAPDSAFSAFGKLDVDYLPHPIDSEQAVIADFDYDRETRLPVKPFAELENGLSLNALLTFGAPTNLPFSAGGIIIDGVMYLQSCKTLYGDFPYCEEMRHSVFSVTKSLGGLVGMLYLAETYGDQVFDLKIKDYVDVTADHEGWEDVTFADALNMATGIGDHAPDRNSAEIDANDYDGDLWTSFAYADSASEKLHAAFSVPTYNWGPGEVFRYSGIDTYVLSAAMDSFVKSHEGPDANIWDSVTRDVLRPIGVMTLPMTHTLELDGARGVPLMLSGAYPNVQDVAKMTQLLHNDGRFGGQQLLSKAKLDEALYRTNVRGLYVNGPWGGTYHMSLWNDVVLHSGCVFDVSSMLGYGGNLVVLLPNDVTIFRFTDISVNSHRNLIRAASEIRSLCPS